jgi:hypothetical protein
MAHEGEAETVATWRSRRYQGVLLVLWILASYALCVWGFLIYHARSAPIDASAWSDAFYHSFRIFGFEYDGPKAPGEVPLPLHIGRLGALIGILWASSQAVLILLRERATSFRLRVRPAAIVFCGLTADALRIAQAQKACDPGLRMAAVAVDPADSVAQQFRQQISRLIVAGDPLVRANLNAVGVDRATRCVYVAGDSDTRSLQITELLVRHIVAARRAACPALRVVATLRDRNLLDALPESLRKVDRRVLELIWVDPAHVAARVLLDRLPADRAPGTAPLHVLVLGSSATASALILQMARNVYPRTRVTRITVIAQRAERFRHDLLGRHPALATQFADAALFGGLHPLVDLRFLEATPATLSQQDLAVIGAEAPVSCAYVLIDDASAGQRAVRRLRQLAEYQHRSFPIAAFFDTPRGEEGVVEVAARSDVFRSRPGEHYPGQFLDETAALLHFAYEPGNVVPPLEESSAHLAAWRTAQERWLGLEEWQRDSSRYAADHIDVKLRAIGLAEYAEAPALSLAAACELQARMTSRLGDLLALEHRRYCAERMLDNWLPIDDAAWNEPQRETSGESRQQAIERHRERLKALRLNATLRPTVSEDERLKDRRLVANIAWVLYARGVA